MRNRNVPHDGKAASNVIYFVRLRMRELNEKTGNIRYGKAEKKRELRGEEEQRQSRDRAIRRKAVKKERSIAPKFPGVCTRKANAAASGSQRICRGKMRVK